MKESSQVPATDPRAFRPGDAQPSSWVDHASPAFRPYLRLMRLDRPIGAWLLFWPCVFGLALGAATGGRDFPNPWSIVLLALGAIVMRGAGCAYNDIVDRDFDAKVERTRQRPIPSGAVSVGGAAAFAALLCFAGLLILLAFNRLAIILGISSLALVAIYPFMKRVTWWPQAWLGLTFNWGVLFGYAAEAGRLDPAAFLFYAGCFFWTLGYDTIYAHQDKEDDALIGVKSMALKLGTRTKPWLYVFYAFAFTLMLSGGLMTGMRFAFVLAMIVPGVHFLWQIRLLNIDRPLLCLKIFKANRDTGALVAFALLLGTWAGV